MARKESGWAIAAKGLVGIGEGYMKGDQQRRTAEAQALKNAIDEETMRFNREKIMTDIANSREDLSMFSGNQAISGMGLNKQNLGSVPKGGTVSDIIKQTFDPQKAGKISESILAGDVGGLREAFSGKRPMTDAEKMVRIYPGMASLFAQGKDGQGMSLGLIDAIKNKTAPKNTVITPPYLDFIKDEKRPAPKQGYRYTSDGGQEIIPGGPVAQAKAASEKKAQLGKEQRQLDAQIVMDSANKAMTILSKAPKNPILGAVKNQIMSQIPGSEAAVLAEALLTIKSKTGFKTLQDIRDASPTGGALGPVSDTENKLLQAALGSISMNLSPQEQMQNVAKISNLYMDAAYGKGNGPDRFPEGPALPPVGSAGRGEYASGQNVSSSQPISPRYRAALDWYASELAKPTQYRSPDFSANESALRSKGLIK